ncbi:hypothetical protein Patl1_33971 [Pistacia atlantica]|uniref:Uncharacterized protein n=1 Tax=Pistacia atlantica TaxID=434234 RepID=A0ACC0ZR52_9ROSI|nr:hypothetical protein Patl1_33971 [Pistacia atlantica]
MILERFHFLVSFSVLVLVLQIKFCSCSYNTQPMNCTDTTRLCTSFLAYEMKPNQTLAVIQSMFDVLPGDVTVEGNGNDYIFVKKNCSCLSTTKNYVSNTTFTVKSNGGYVYDVVVNAYDGLGFLNGTSRMARVGEVVSLRLYCGCSSALWNYLMSYVLKEGDTLQSLASRFGISMDSIEQANGIGNPNNVTVGNVYYIPLNSVPGEPYPVENDSPPAPVPAPSADTFEAIEVDHKDHVPYGWIVGGLGAGLALIVLSIVGCICLRSSSCCFTEGQGNSAKDRSGKSSHKFHILRKPSFCCASGRYVGSKSGDNKQTTAEASHPPVTIPKALGTDVFDMEKPVVFTYDDILFSTDGFSDSNLLGHGTYGSVYYGNLRNQEVAIKRMTATKTKEFMAEMKILCKVHHTNLVKLFVISMMTNLYEM